MSLISPHNEIWRYDYLQSIKEIYCRLDQNKNYQVDVDRVEFIACHMQSIEPDDNMDDIDAGETEQYLNLFALVIAKK